MNFFRKVLQSKCKNEISLEANAYVVASSIHIGVLNPNPANLLINFSTEKVKHFYGPYKIFSDIVQENKKSFVFLLGVLKNDQLIYLQPELFDDENIIKSNASNNVLHFTSYEETDCSKKFGPEKSQNMSFWERLSKPAPRALQNLEKKQASKMKSEALKLSIDGNFIKERMTKKSKKLTGISFVKIKERDSKKNSIHWEYYTVDDAYIKKSWCVSNKKNKTQSSSMTNSSVAYSETTISQPNTNQSTSLDSDQSCIEDEKDISEILHKAATEKNKNSKLNLSCREEPLSFTHDLCCKEVKHSTPIIQAGQACSQDSSSNDHSNFKAESLVGENNETIYCTATENITESAEVQEKSSVDMECTTEKSSQVNAEIEPSDDTSNMVLHVFAKVPQQSVETAANSGHQEIETYEHTTGRKENSENTSENVTVERMEEIILSLIRNTKTPVSIDILARSDTDNSSCQSMRSKERDKYFKQDVSHGRDKNAHVQEDKRKYKVLNVEVQRLHNRIPNNVDDSSSTLSSIETENMNELLKSIWGSCESISSLFSVSSDDTSDATYILKKGINSFDLSTESLAGIAGYEQQKSKYLHQDPDIQKWNLKEQKSPKSNLNSQFHDATFCVARSTENLATAEEINKQNNYSLTRDVSTIISEILQEENLQELNSSLENNKVNVKIEEEREKYLKIKTANELISPIVEEVCNSKSKKKNCENWTQTENCITQNTGNKLKIVELPVESFENTKTTDGTESKEILTNFGVQELNISDIVKKSKKLIASVDKKLKPNNDKLIPWWVRLSASRSPEEINNTESKPTTTPAGSRRNAIGFGRTLSHRSPPSHTKTRTRALNKAAQSLEPQVSATKSQLEQLVQVEQELKNAQSQAKEARSKPIVSDRIRRLSQPKFRRTPISMNVSTESKATWRI